MSHTKATLEDRFAQATHLDVSHWLRMMGRLDDPVVARLVLGFLDSDPHLRARHPGAFLQASETVKRAQIRFAKGYARGRLVGSMCLSACRGLGWLAKSAAALAVAGITTVVVLASRRAGVAKSTERGVVGPAYRRCTARVRQPESHARRAAKRFGN
jgi:hypothetical protein